MPSSGHIQGVMSAPVFKPLYLPERLPEMLLFVLFSYIQAHFHKSNLWNIQL